MDTLDSAHGHNPSANRKKLGKTYVMDNDVGATLLHSSDFRTFEKRAQVIDPKGAPVNVFSSYPEPYNFDVKDDLTTIRDSVIDVDYDDVPVEDAPYIGFEPNIYLPEKSGHFKWFNKLSTPNFKQRRVLYDRASNHEGNTLFDRRNYVGDKNITTLRIDQNLARQQQIGVDTEIFGLGPENRTSPIYTKMKPEDRLPRPPLPADTHTHLSPTLGILHAYRLHHAQMYLAEKRKVNKIRHAAMLDYVDIDKISLKLPAISGVKNIKPYEDFLVRAREEIKLAKFGFGYKEKAYLLKTLKKLIPIFATVPEQKVEARRRRRK